MKLTEKVLEKLPKIPITKESQLKDGDIYCYWDIYSGANGEYNYYEKVSDEEADKFYRKDSFIAKAIDTAYIRRTNKWAIPIFGKALHQDFYIGWMNLTGEHTIYKVLLLDTKAAKVLYG
jgi:hypothetical protein